MVQIEKIHLVHLKFSEYKQVQELMSACYPNIEDPTWNKAQIQKLTKIFPDGQIVIKVDDKIVACALSIIIDYKLFENKHTYLDISFAQSVVFTPCDFSFPTTGIKAEATPNTEMILIVDVDLNLLKELHEKGSVRTKKDRRTDLYEVIAKQK